MPKAGGVLGLVALLAVLAPGRAALAADPGTAAKSKAKALLRKGNAAYKKGQFQAALKDFQQAYEAFPSAKLLFNEGQAYKELKQYDAAADAFTAFLAEASADTKLADQSVEAARAALREVDPQVVLVRVDVSPRGASLTLDGRPVRADFHLLRGEDPGTVHKLDATAAGYQPAETTVTLPDAMKWAASKQFLHLELKPVEAAPTIVAAPTPSPTIVVPVPAPQPQPTPAPVVINNPPPDQKPQPATTVTPTPTQLAQNEKPAPAPTAAVSTPAPEAGPSHVPAIVAFGVAGACAAGATAFGIMAMSQKGKLSCGSSTNPCTSTSDIQAANDAHHTAQISDLLWLGTAVAGGTGAVLWFVAPGGSGSGGEVGVSGRF